MKMRNRKVENICWKTKQEKQFLNSFWMKLCNYILKTYLYPSECDLHYQIMSDGTLWMGQLHPIH